jgi:hypothetical protein
VIGGDGSVSKEKLIGLAVARANGDPQWSNTMKATAAKCFDKCIYFPSFFRTSNYFEKYFSARNQKQN